MGAELGELSKAREYIEKALQLDPTLAVAKSELARISAKEKSIAMQDGEKVFLTSKQKLEEMFKKGDAAQVKDLLKQIKDVIAAGNVSWEVVKTSKVGKIINEIKNKPPRGDKD